MIINTAHLYGEENGKRGKKEKSIFGRHTNTNHINLRRCIVINAKHRVLNHGRKRRYKIF